MGAAVPAADAAWILEAIRDEMVATDDCTVFEVEQVTVVETRPGDALWRVSVRLDDKSRRGLQEDLEGQTAWWPGPPKGTADVLTVLPDEGEVVLRFATVAAPQPGSNLFIYPPQYLEALRDAWQDASWRGQCLEWMTSVQRPPRLGFPSPDPSLLGVPLRKAQREAFALVRASVGFLWGPPGTGKTYTLGALLAQYLRQFMRRRVLLLSTTNVAVDQALVAVDKGLETAGASRAERSACSRVGQHYVASQYLGREHLLPRPDPELLARLRVLESSRPDTAAVRPYDEWKREVAALRAHLRVKARNVLQSARLAATTTTAAAFLLETLKELAPYDLVVFDEASQVALAHAACLAPLGTVVLFAGDPQQLEPIVRSGAEVAKSYFGCSPFVYRGPDAVTCFLDEQSRMSKSICQVVSKVFYQRRLRVADDAARDPVWVAARTPEGPTPLARTSVHVEHGFDQGTWSATYGGLIRWSTATWIGEHVHELVDGVPEDQVIVLTPFRAQRRLIRQKLRGAGLRDVAVSTVHRFQGSERHTVVFDPVDGLNAFFLEHGERLTTVALSRAQCRLVVLVSPGDLANDTLRAVCSNAGTSGPRPPHRCTPVTTVAGRPDFPHCAIGREFWFEINGGFEGRVEEVLPAQFIVLDLSTGVRRKFVTARFTATYGGPAGDLASLSSATPVAGAPTGPQVRRQVVRTPPPRVATHPSGARLVRPPRRP